MTKDLPTPATLRKLLRYEHLTGLLFWRERGAEWFKDAPKQSAKAAAKGFNTQYAGQEALSYVGNHGYKCGAVQGVALLAHRAIIAMELGEWPIEVDHESGVRTDNRLLNLAPSNRKDNCKNLSIKSNNTSGVTGVHWAEGRRKWRARINAGDREKFIGYFDDFADAVKARIAAEQECGYHVNHGRLAQPSAGI